MTPTEIIGQQMDMLFKAGYDAAKNNSKNKTLEEVADKEAVKKAAMEDMDCWSVNEHLKVCNKHNDKTNN